MRSIAQTIPGGATAIVFDVAASSGGAMAVLADFYEDALSVTIDGTEIYLVHRNGDFPSTGSLHVLRYSWPKRGWLRRLLFELVVAPRLVRSTKASSVVSLQNIMVPFVPKRMDRILLVHTCLPFIEERVQPTERPTALGLPTRDRTSDRAIHSRVDLYPRADGVDEERDSEGCRRPE